MTVHQRRLKIIMLTIDGVDYSCQINSWTIDPGIKTGDRNYTFCAAGEGENMFIEETDGEPTLEVKGFADWTAGGFSDFCWSHNMETVAFQLDHMPDIPDEHVQFSGKVQIQAHAVGGDARDTEGFDVTWPIALAIPVYERVSG